MIDFSLGGFMGEGMLDLMSFFAEVDRFFEWMGLVVSIGFDFRLL
jgi:hypothetical protein